MNNVTTSKLSFIKPLAVSTATVALLTIAAPLMTSSLFSDTSVFAAEKEEQRAPPPTRSSQTLSKRVYQRIEEVMELRDLEDYPGALAILDEIKDMYDKDRLNDREKYTMWLFYASIDQSQQNYPEAIQSYNEILKLENLTPVQLEQTLYYIGSLYFAEENYAESIAAFDRYNSVALEENEDVYLRIGTAYYQLEEYQKGIPPILKAMEIQRAKGEAVVENTYSLLRAMYISLEDYENARQVLREMIVLFNTDDDWLYLAGITGQMELSDEQARTYYISNVLGYLDSEGELMSLAAQLYNNENPYGAATVVAKGMSDGLIKEDVSNLSFLSQSYQIAREDALAAEPLEKAADLTDNGKLYARLGQIYLTMSEFEKAANAFDMAFDKGDLERPDQTYIQQARAFLEFNKFDDAITALRKAAKDKRSESAATTWINYIENEKARYNSLEERRELFKDYF